MPGARTTLAEDCAAARAVIPTLADRSSELLARVRVPEAASPLPGWTAGDVAVHLGLACTAYAAAVIGDSGFLESIPVPAPGADVSEHIADLNALVLTGSTLADRQAAPARVRTAAETIVAATAGREPAEPCHIPWFGELHLSTVLGLFLSETLLHTLDVARASRQKWPIPPGTARLILSLVFPELMPRTVHRERAAKLDAAVRLHVRGGVTIGVEVDRGEVRTVRNPGPGRTDCHISVDPVGFLLAASGRASQNRQIALGRMVPYGRKPWLAPRIAGLFYYP